MGIFSNNIMPYKKYKALSELTIDGEKVDNEEEYNLDDAGDEETTTTSETEETTENPDEGSQETEPDDEFSLQNNEGEEEETQETETEETTENTEDIPSEEDDEIKKAEDTLYDALSEDQKKIRILQLKLGFKDLYTETDAILTAINNIPKQDDNIETIRRLIAVLNDVKQYILDYMSTQFDKRSYLDNNQIYIKYINVFRTIRKVIDELNHNK